MAMQAFDKQSAVFDQLYGADPQIAYKRRRVREHFESLLNPSSRILELNAGTGEDALYFAEKGHLVHATDISEKMQEVLKAKVAVSAYRQNISTEICSFESLENLVDKGPYDAIFSNFAGLNCTNKLKEILDSFPFLVKPGGIVTLIILPSFCLWEFLLLFRGRFKTAFRRFAGKKGARAHIEGNYFRCWYYSPGFVKKNMAKNFDLVKQEGLCSMVPPSYLQAFDKKYPRIYNYLVKKEEQSKGKWPWKNIGDYYIISFRKK
jgi:ubiquinone/menaquinone biosynthesis C-methylase UbiE